MAAVLHTVSNAMRKRIAAELDRGELPSLKKTKDALGQRGVAICEQQGHARVRRGANAEGQPRLKRQRRV